MRPEDSKTFLQVLWASQLSKYLRFFRWKITCNIPWRPLYRMIAELNDKRYESGYTGFHLHSGLSPCIALLGKKKPMLHVILLASQAAMTNKHGQAVRLYIALYTTGSVSKKFTTAMQKMSFCWLNAAKFNLVNLHLSQYLDCVQNAPWNIKLLRDLQGQWALQELSALNEVCRKKQ